MNVFKVSDEIRFKITIKSGLKAQPLSMLNCIKFKFQDNGKLLQRGKVNGTQPFGKCLFEYRLYLII